jgi:UDP-N-acetylglucosamine 2-epimerase (non-hydrolysing)
VIIFIYGTTAEAIKIAPIARRLDARSIPYESWVTFQHTESLEAIIPELGLREPSQVIAFGNGGKPLTGWRDVWGWLTSIQRWKRRNLRRLRRELPPGSVVVVQGDTLTTVVGARLAKRLRVPCAHVEAGLRSGNWRHPFPEELDRRLADRLASIHYVPSPEAAAHLSTHPNVVCTFGNTVVDEVMDRGREAAKGDAPFGVVLLHRFEFISNREVVEATFRTLAEESPYPLRLVVDAFSGHGLQETLAAYGDSRFVIQEKLAHPDFIGLLRGASFVVTDSGGIQAEAALIGVPTLIHRKTTEQEEGMGENVILSGWKPEVLSEFLAHHQEYRRETRRPDRSPSDIIVEDLIARGLAK